MCSFIRLACGYANYVCPLCTGLSSNLMACIILVMKMLRVITLSGLVVAHTASEYKVFMKPAGSFENNIYVLLQIFWLHNATLFNQWAVI